MNTGENDVQTAEGKYAGLNNDELMALWVERVGTLARPTINDAPFCRLINEDSILNVCLSVGDLNPLWLGSDYGLTSPYGANLAPPFMLFALAPWSMHGTVFFGICDEAGVHLPRPGEGGVQGGITLEWHRRLRLGDRIACEARLAAARTHKSRTWGRTFELVVEFTFRDQFGEHVATGSFSWLGTEHRDVQVANANLTPKIWTEEEIEGVRGEYAGQLAKARGGVPRYWEDVSVGDRLPTIVKGPYTEMSYIAFSIGVPLRPVNATDEVYWNHAYETNVRLWPHRGPIGSNEPTRQGVPTGHRYHFDYESARRRNLPAPIDVGHQRVCWLIQLLTMWMGDHALLRKLNTRHVDVNMMGDLTHCTGIVSGKAIEDGNYVVRCDVSCESQRGPSTRGTAEIVLPSRQPHETAAT
jgi:N-terminal half of MaoC dehydratase